MQVCNILKYTHDVIRNGEIWEFNSNNNCTLNSCKKYFPIYPILQNFAIKLDNCYASMTAQDKAVLRHAIINNTILVCFVHKLQACW